MLTQETVEFLGTTTATDQEMGTAIALMTEEESVISDAPVCRPEATGALLLGLLISCSPKEPKERDRR
ncbi:MULTISPECIES: hypothetical protein [Streptomycetaceae]|uniref:Uncharacterized protein n=1 Tax=Streptantibioticus cattleyicolor (strain ATCC 35852 / DSM 46488 / JCM 4925 / NBRC 14057 / NRRL 8057) TaxID=1003195 RepID=F8JNP9_STREN|nr:MULTISPECIES: hypothetical protein [Streptomycetaceae]AEW92629.1 hypothetical protein SCATT_02580 [Streptantibioticus cattleyicolor NRRL 8057 = DSM 46488]MYS57407.1 hypothetical protein [Streptomyces sp. SID5468]CCB72984.1 protein of unknown function [Streptantibioticus cattleyicolor NRRL 8057 = DSM 46488]